MVHYFEAQSPEDDPKVWCCAFLRYSPDSKHEGKQNSLIYLQHVHGPTGDPHVT